MIDIAEIIVPGEAQPKGSLRAIPVRRKDGTMAIGMKNDNAKTKEWQDLVTFHAMSAMKHAKPHEGAVTVSAMFRLTRPRSHFLKGGQLRPGLNLEHVDKPDSDKLLRCVLDALTRVCYVDDCQVVTVSGTKAYVEPPTTSYTVIVVRGVN